MVSVKQYGWPDETVARLKKLWADGLSASTIAQRLGNGLTRNAVIGKVSRLKLPGRRTTSIMQGKVTARKNRLYRREAPRAMPKRPILPVEPLPPREETDIARVSFNQLDKGMCRFIPGDPCEDFGMDKPLYCGEATVPGQAYCVHHARRCAEPDRLPRQNHNYARYVPQVIKKQAVYMVHPHNLELAE